MKPEIEVWGDRAEVDFRSATKALTPPDPMPEATGYLAQRSVEKSLKALLRKQGLRFR